MSKIWETHLNGLQSPQVEAHAPAWEIGLSWNDD